jgi:hypothetical protein
VADMATRWDSQWMIESRLRTRECTAEELMAKVLFARKYDPPEHFLLQRIPVFFEELGVRERLGAAALRDINLTLGPSIVRHWKVWEPATREIRRRSDPTAWENFEKLANKVRDAMPAQPPGTTPAESEA